MNITESAHDEMLRQIEERIATHTLTLAPVALFLYCAFPICPICTSIKDRAFFILIAAAKAAALLQMILPYCLMPLLDAATSPAATVDYWPTLQ